MQQAKSPSGHWPEGLFCIYSDSAVIVAFICEQGAANRRHDPKIEVIAVKEAMFHNRLAGYAYKDMTKSVDKIEKMRRCPFGRCM
ncbi:hypothetical protein [Cobetia sp. 5-11-6-3]|uniref:hypothetical protein n=1 Tax=Cobetia sp. 5-11-6-3 TaxID=2737458 RepID=UPI001596FD8C|nr:hypothetical protein [Cobetia sp. 5-11-6-3]